VTDVRLEAPAPWAGVVGLLDPAGFGKDRLPPIPRAMGIFTVGAFVRGDLRAATAALYPDIKSEYREGFRALDEAFRNATSPSLREDLYRHLGPIACAFAAPPGHKGSTDATMAVLIGIDDADAVGKALDALASRLNAFFGENKAEERVGASNHAGEKRRPSIVLERIPAPDRGYRLKSHGGLIPWLKGDEEPTVLVGKSFLAVADSPAGARDALAAETRPAERWLPTGELAGMFESLPPKTAFLVVGNPRDSFWPDAVAKLPETVDWIASKFGGANGGQERLAVPSLKLPNAEQLRALLFPSVLAAAVDDRSFRIVTLEALPFCCMRTQSRQTFSGSGAKVDIDFKFAPHR
jgi:hypothetical protein